MYKLIALDLDGTLLNDNKEISRKDLDTIHHLIDLGYEVVIATGRGYYSARMLTGNIREHLIYMCNNGNITIDALNDKVISTKFLQADDSNLILKEGFVRNLDPIIYVDYFHQNYDIILDKNNYYIDKYIEGSNLRPRVKVVKGKLDENLDRVLAIVYPESLNVLKDFNYYINELYPYKYNSHVIENVDVSEGLLEIMNPLGTKWNTLVEYASSIGIKSEEIIAIGDDNNDIEMIMNAGLGIAMKNGGKLVKEVANQISKRDNNDSGVSFELKKIFNI